MTDECEIDLTRTPILRELLGITLKKTRPIAYTEPRKRWPDERRIAASERASERMRERIEAEAAKVAFANLTEMEKRIIARLSERDDMTGEQITTASWPRLEEISAWEAMRDLEKKGLIFHDAVSRWAWRLTGCGRILMIGRGQGAKV